MDVTQGRHGVTQQHRKKIVIFFLFVLQVPAVAVTP